MLMTIRQYAISKNITYEAIRKQIVRYDRELNGMFVQKGRTKYLTDAAIKFLDGRRAINPIIEFKEREKTEHEEQKNELEALRQENKVLLLKITELQDEKNGLMERLIQSKDDVLRIQSEHLQKLEANNRKWWQFGKK